MEKELHEKMEFAWKSIAALRGSLEIETTELRCSFGNYVRIDGELTRQDYPVPTFQIINIGEVGYDYDKFYLVVAVERLSIIREFIEELLKIEYRTQIYGAKNFLKELSNGREPEETFKNIENYDEEVIQIEIDFSESEVKKFKEILEWLRTLLERHRITIVPVKNRPMRMPPTIPPTEAEAACNTPDCPHFRVRQSLSEQVYGSSFGIGEDSNRGHE